MIVDLLDNDAVYAASGDSLRRAFDFLAAADFPAMASGRHDIDGERVFALVQRYETKPGDTCVWEAHRRYIDVQFLAQGIETVGYAPIGTLRTTKPYTAEGDCELFAGAGDHLTLRAGMFAVFFPADAHMPCMTAGSPTQVLKVVVKVAV